MKAIFFLALLLAVAWLLWPFLSPHIDRAKEAEPAKVMKINPLKK